MQSTAWGRFRGSNGWDTNHFLALENGQIKGATLVLSKRLPAIRKKIYYIPRGPVVGDSDGKTLSFMLMRISEYVRRNEGLFARADPYLEESDECDRIFGRSGYRRVGKTWSYWNCPKFVFWLGLEDGIDAVYGRIERKKRWEIRSAKKNGIRIVKGGKEDLGDFYRLMIETASRKNIGIHGFDYYDSFMDSIRDGTASQLFLARYDDETAAAGISIAYGRNAWLFYFSSSEKYFHLHPNRALQWEMIKWAAERGCVRYDLRGTAASDPPRPSDPGFGVYKFKKSFNPEYIRTAGYYDYVAHPRFYRIFRIVEDHFLPLAVRSANMVMRHRGLLPKRDAQPEKG